MLTSSVLQLVRFESVPCFVIQNWNCFMANTRSTELPIACQLTNASEIGERMVSASDLFASADETRELPDGYACRFPGTRDAIERLFSFIAVEHECCVFLRYELLLEPDHGPTWLRLTGEDGDGVKNFLRNAFLISASSVGACSFADD